MLRHVGGAADFIFVPGDEHAVAGHHQIRFDVVRAFFDRKAIGLDRVFRTLTARASMRNVNYVRQESA